MQEKKGGGYMAACRADTTGEELPWEPTIQSLAP